MKKPIPFDELLEIEEQLPPDVGDTWNMDQEPLQKLPKPDYVYSPHGMKRPDTVVISLDKKLYANLDAARERMKELAPLRGVKVYHTFGTASHYVFYTLPVKLREG